MLVGMDYSYFWCILPAAFMLDLLAGDPRALPHPVRWMGSSVSILEPRFRQLPVNLGIQGAFFAACLIAGAWITTYITIKIAAIVHPVAGVVLEIILVYYSLSARSLEKAAMSVWLAIKQSGLSAAREKVGRIVGREVDKLSERGVIRATVETVAENLVDGFISPLFYAVIGGAPLAMAYKMINTLDSMIGYKNDRYILFGKAAARIDDFANYIPARLSVPVIALAAHLLGGQGRRVFKISVKEGLNHSSPNAGFPEAAFAAALGIKLGGPNYYHGQLVSKPYIGVQFKEARTRHIKMACRLMLLSSMLWAGILWGVVAAACLLF